jgi:hypothetical protein
MAAIRATNFVGPPFPEARHIVPEAYRSFAEMANRGGVVEATGNERNAVMALEVREIALTLREDVRRYLEMMQAITAPGLDRTVRQEITRMADRIRERVERGGEGSVRINPQRSAPNMSDLATLLTAKWNAQLGQCVLCGGRLKSGTANPMLRSSADRIDSANGAYTEDNVQITHLACNLAKNQYGGKEFGEWLDTVRGDVAREIGEFQAIPTAEMTS